MPRLTGLVQKQTSKVPAARQTDRIAKQDIPGEEKKLLAAHTTFGEASKEKHADMYDKASQQVQL